MPTPTPQQINQALLDLVAETFDYFAGQAEAKDERTDKGKPVAEYKRADAARARTVSNVTANGGLYCVTGTNNSKACTSSTLVLA